MDKSLLIGVVIGCGVFGMLAFGGGNNPMWFADTPSFIVTCIGSVAAIFVALPLGLLLSLPTLAKKAIADEVINYEDAIEDFVKYADTARRDGILALEGTLNEIRDDFTRRGLMMAVDGSEPGIIQQIMETEIEAMEERHAFGRSLFEAWGKYAPAFGMIGTLFGLVVMLQNMDDPSKIGPGMAVAIITTLYGAVMANFLLLPVADKLKTKSSNEVLLRKIILKGVMSIQLGDNPRVVRQKLEGYLPPSKRPKEERKK